MPALPGWNSVSTASRLHDFFELAGIVLLGLLVIAEGFAFAYGHRKDYLVQSPRALSIEQQQRIIASMSPFKGLRAVLGAVPPSAANTKFLEEILHVLKAADVDAFINLNGVEASVSPTGASNRGRMLTEGFPSGVVIYYVTGNKRGEAFSKTLAQALNDADITALARGGRDEEMISNLSPSLS
jgi:hypothetical protein